MREFKTFGELSVGDAFCFAAEAEGLGLAPGPWVKVSARRYRHESDELHAWYGGPLRVGTVRLKVYSPVR